MEKGEGDDGDGRGEVEGDKEEVEGYIVQRKGEEWQGGRGGCFESSTYSVLKERGMVDRKGGGMVERKGGGSREIVEGGRQGRENGKEGGEDASEEINTVCRG